MQRNIRWIIFYLYADFSLDPTAPDLLRQMSYNFEWPMQVAILGILTMSMCALKYAKKKKNYIVWVHSRVKDISQTLLRPGELSVNIIFWGNLRYFVAHWKQSPLPLASGVYHCLRPSPLSSLALTLQMYFLVDFLQSTSPNDMKGKNRAKELIEKKCWLDYQVNLKGNLIAHGNSLIQIFTIQKYQTKSLQS